MNVDKLFASVCGAATCLRKVAKGGVVFVAGVSSAGIYTVRKGRVRIERVTEAGRQAVLYVANPGDPFAEASIFSEVYHCSAIALSNTSLNFYPKEVLLREFLGNLEFARAYAKLLGRQLMLARVRLERAKIRNAGDRVRHFLTLETGPEGYSLESSGALKDLAANLSLTPEALYRTLAKMSKAGCIEQTAGAIRLR